MTQQWLRYLKGIDTVHLLPAIQDARVPGLMLEEEREKFPHTR